MAATVSGKTSGHAGVSAEREGNRVPFRKGAPRPADAGRCAGTPNRKTAERREALQRALEASRISPVEADSMTPLEVLLEAMRRHWAAGNMQEAVLVAEKACPFMHPRLSSID